MIVEVEKIWLRIFLANNCLQLLLNVIQNFEPMKRSVLIRERLFECIHNGEVVNDDLVQIIEMAEQIKAERAVLAMQKFSSYE